MTALGVLISTIAIGVGFYQAHINRQHSFETQVLLTFLEKNRGDQITFLQNTKELPCFDDEFRKILEGAVAPDIAPKIVVSDDAPKANDKTSQNVLLSLQMMANSASESAS